LFDKEIWQAFNNILRLYNTGMALILIFGINGVGKDTLEVEMRKKYGDLVGIVLTTRVLFKSLGFDVNYFYGEPAPTSEKLAEMYKVLEATSKSKVDEIMNFDLPQKLLEVKSKFQLGFLSAHLVSATRKPTGEIHYKTGYAYPWFKEFVDGFVYLRSTPEELLRRREDENRRGIRKRLPMTLDEIALQLQISDKEWKRFEKILPNDKPRTTINNDSDLDETMRQFDYFATNLYSQLALNKL
jgi:guanylate kinase